ncbi:hypothetical protein [Polyangium aurulentum]|uniref:hypothetical protein n=1 Tax=Polyangium aurulentum TaxID=2567896 RepID=UPI0010AE0CDD|nr:hypothetical protein [Polyangium aurulentum]UQA57643.1 hypothetical protein E8A73_041245 [Polyangium aurulentum]
MTISIDAQKAYDKFLPEAQALAPQALIPYRLDPDLAVINVQTALPAILAKKADIVAHLPKVDLGALLALPELAIAVKFAALRAEQAAPSEKSISRNLAEARKIRRALLSVARGLAATGLVPDHEVDAIAAGKGNRDIAEDCVALADLYRKHEAAIAGKHAVGDADVEKAASVGSWLLATMRPGNAPPEKAGPPPASVDARNRLATLLVQRHSELRKVVHYFHGEAYEDLAPSLQSRRLERDKQDPPPADPPAALGR